MHDKSAKEKDAMQFIACTEEIHAEAIVSILNETITTSTTL